MKIGGIHSTGNFKFPDTETDNPATGAGDNLLPQTCWSDVTTSAKYTVPTPKVGDDHAELTKDSISLTGGNSWMLIPQKLTAWDGIGAGQNGGAYLAVLCQIYAVGKEGDFETLLYPSSTRPSNPDDTVKDGFAYAAVPIDTNWEPGYKYIYTLEFYGAGKVDPDDPTHGGEEILGGPIKFTVSVDDWADKKLPLPMVPGEPEEPVVPEEPGE